MHKATSDWQAAAFFQGLSEESFSKEEEDLPEPYIRRQVAQEENMACLHL